MRAADAPVAPELAKRATSHGGSRPRSYSQIEMASRSAVARSGRYGWKSRRETRLDLRASPSDGDFRETSIIVSWHARARGGRARQRRAGGWGARAGEACRAPR